MMMCLIHKKAVSTTWQSKDNTQACTHVHQCTRPKSSGTAHGCSSSIERLVAPPWCIDMTLGGGGGERERDLPKARTTWGSE